MHVLTFLQKVKKFTLDNGITSRMKVDKDNVVDDVLETWDTTGGIIAEMDNSLYETLSKLEDYYIKTNNKAALKRLYKIIKN